jgi:hypothetical protein
MRATLRLQVIDDVSNKLAMKRNRVNVTGNLMQFSHGDVIGSKKFHEGFRIREIAVSPQPAKFVLGIRVRWES